MAVLSTKKGVWLAFDPQNQQVLAFYVGDHSRQSARKLWRLYEAE